MLQWIALTDRNLVNIQIKWTPPPLGWFKLNSNGSSEGNPGKVGGGCLIRNSDGIWISGSSVLAELWALRDGFALALPIFLNQMLWQWSPFQIALLMFTLFCDLWWMIAGCCCKGSLIPLSSMHIEKLIRVLMLLLDLNMLCHQILSFLLPQLRLWAVTCSCLVLFFSCFLLSLFTKKNILFLFREQI